MRIGFSFIILLLSIVLSSCREEGVLINENVQINNHTWNNKDSVKFHFEVKDTLKYYDVFFNLRITDSYPWSNIYIFSELRFPNNKTRKDTFEFYLADKMGKWQGINSGSTVQNTIKLYNDKVNFPLSGDYSLTICQGMRDHSLSEIMDVGLKIQEIINSNSTGKK